MYGAFLLFEDEFIHVVAITFTALILTELLMVALTIRTWHYLMIVAELFSVAVYVLSLVVLRNYFGKYVILVALTMRTWHYLIIVAELLSVAVYVLLLVALRNYFGK